MRKIEELVDGYFSKDIKKVMDVMIGYATRDAYVADAYNGAIEQVEKLRRAGLMPDAVYEDFLTYMDKDVANKKHILDVMADESLNAIKIGSLMDKMAGAFGRQVASPIKALSQSTRWFLINGALGLKPRLPIRNYTQRLLAMDLFPVRDLAFAQKQQLTGYFPTLPDGRRLDEAVKESDWWKLTERQFTELERGPWQKFTDVPLRWYRQSHLSNVMVTARVAYLDWLRKFNASQDPSHPYYKKLIETAKADVLRESEAAARAFARKQTQNIKDPQARAKKEGALIQSFNKKRCVATDYERVLDGLKVKEEDLLPMLRRGVQLTQWEYWPTSMPWMFRSDLGKMAFSLQSWWQNYYGVHAREMAQRFSTGRDGSGKVLWDGQRRQAIRGLGLIVGLSRAVESLIGVQMATNLIPRPGTRMSPVGEFTTGFVDFAYGISAGDPALRKEGALKMKHAGKLMIPLYGGVKEFIEWQQGQKSTRSYLGYPTEAQKKKEKKK